MGKQVRPALSQEAAGLGLILEMIGRKSVQQGQEMSSRRPARWTWVVLVGWAAYSLGALAWHTTQQADTAAYCSTRGASGTR